MKYTIHSLWFLFFIFPVHFLNYIAFVIACYYHCPKTAGKVQICHCSVNLPEPNPVLVGIYAIWNSAWNFSIQILQQVRFGHLNLPCLPTEIYLFWKWFCELWFIHHYTIGNGPFCHKISVMWPHLNTNMLFCKSMRLVR